MDSDLEECSLCCCCSACFNTCGCQQEVLSPTGLFNFLQLPIPHNLKKIEAYLKEKKLEESLDHDETSEEEDTAESSDTEEEVLLG